METYRAVVDEEGQLVLDEAGRFVPGEPVGLFVMGKEPGFGAAYAQNRTGDWAYAQFGLDGTPLPSQNTGGYAACHAHAGATRDWTWRTNLFFYGESGAPRHRRGSRPQAESTCKPTCRNNDDSGRNDGHVVQ
jgi:hypothetical protein